MTGDFAGGLDDFFYGVTLAVAEVVGAVLISDGSEREDVGLGEIGHVDVIADAGAVRSVVIAAEHEHPLPFSLRYLEDDGNDVELRGVVLAPLGAGSGGVEKAQRREVEERMDFRHPVEVALDNELRLPVWTAGDDALLFIDRHPLGIVEKVGGGGKDETRHLELDHAFQEVEGVGHVVAEVEERIFHRLADQ